MSTHREPVAPHPAATTRKPKRLHRVIQQLRRLHLYTGLLLAPWAIFFGVSALLFNHPEVGETPKVRRLSTDELAPLTGFEALDPDASAEVVAATMPGPGGPYTVDESFRARFDGFARLVAPRADGGEYTAIVDLERGRIDLRSPLPRASSPAVEPAPFAGPMSDTAGPRMADIATSLAPLGEALELDTQAPFEVARRGAPSLEFRAIDAAGVSWNVVYDLGSGELTGRPARGPSGYGLKRVLGGLHKTHHYPDYGGARFVWVLLADLTAVVLIFWALSGLLMWTQLKRHRRIGAILVAASLGAAAVVFVGAVRDLTFEGSTRR